MTVETRSTPSFFAAASWGLDALLALAVSAPVVAALRAQWPHLGADALLASGGLELFETMRDRGPVFSAALLTFILLALLRWGFSLGLDVWHAQTLGSTRRGFSLVVHQLGVRVAGGVPTGLFLAAACSPLYAIRDVPIASLTTRGNLVLALGLAGPSLVLAVLSMGVERVARGFVSSADEGFNSAWMRATRSILAGDSHAFGASVLAVVATFAFGVLAALVARVGYGAGLVASQTLLFFAAYLRARAFARASREALTKSV